MTAAAGRWNDLSKRLVTGLMAAAVGVSAMWTGGFVFLVLVACIAGLIVWEITRMIGAGSLAVGYGIVAGVALLVSERFSPGLAIPFFIVLSIAGAPKLAGNRSLFVMFSAATLVAAYGMVLLREDFGFVWIVWMAMCVIASDVLGYFAGRMIGGPKFWPRVSPKKTWSGTIAGWGGAALVGGALVALGHASAMVIAVSVLVAVAGQFGDVAESALKRKVGVKDSSAILPGHGGMFDRFDAMLGAALFVFLIVLLGNFPAVAM